MLLMPSKHKAHAQNMAIVYWCSVSAFTWNLFRRGISCGTPPLYYIRDPSAHELIDKANPASIALRSLGAPVKTLRRWYGIVPVSGCRQLGQQEVFPGYQSLDGDYRL